MVPDMRSSPGSRAACTRAAGLLPPMLLLALLIVACGSEPDRTSTPPAGEAGPIAACDALLLEEGPRARPVVLILADTLRRDRLGAYGGAARTPRFDAFASRNHLFTRATTQAPWTKPAMATLFTGRNPSSHGVLSHPELRQARDGELILESDALREEASTLAETLAEAGYRTAAFVSNPWMKAELGFAQGFDVFDDSFASNTTPGTLVSTAGVQWLRSLPEDGRPWFLYLHYMDPHAPYTAVDRQRMQEALPRLREDGRPLPRRSSRQIERLARDPGGRSWVRAGAPANLALMELVYDQGVERFDAALGLFLDRFDELPGSEAAAILVVSDHGEALFHRGWRGHGLGLHADETAVPVAARLPGVRGPSRVDCPLGLVDLRSTLCAYLGLDCDADDGTSLLDGGNERYLLVEGVKGKPGNRAILSGRYKLVVQPDGVPDGAVSDRTWEEALYDVVRDPEEERNLLREAEDPEQARAVARRLRAELERLSRPRRAEPAPRTRLDDPMRERLEALGYLDPSEDPPPDAD